VLRGPEGPCGAHERVGLAADRGRWNPASLTARIDSASKAASSTAPTHHWIHRRARSDHPFRLRRPSGDACAGPRALAGLIGQSSTPPPRGRNPERRPRTAQRTATCVAGPTEVRAGPRSWPPPASQVLPGGALGRAADRHLRRRSHRGARWAAQRTATCVAGPHGVRVGRAADRHLRRRSPRGARLAAQLTATCVAGPTEVRAGPRSGPPPASQVPLRCAPGRATDRHLRRRSPRGAKHPATTLPNPEERPEGAQDPATTLPESGRTARGCSAPRHHATGIRKNGPRVLSTPPPDCRPAASLRRSGGRRQSDQGRPPPIRLGAQRAPGARGRGPTPTPPARTPAPRGRTTRTGCRGRASRRRTPS